VLNLGEDGEHPVGTGWAGSGLMVIPDPAQRVRDRLRAGDRAGFGLVVIPDPAHSVHDPILTSRR